MKRMLLTLLPVILLCGCVHKVDYKLSDQDRWAGPSIHHVVYVKPFVDHSTAFTNREVKIGSETWRTNYRKGYAKTNLSEQATAAIAKHLSYSGLFTKVVSGTNANADWVLSGTLSQFEALGRVNSTAENVQAVGAGFGLIGALAGAAATAKMTSTLETKVELNELTLHDSSGKLLWSDSITVSNRVEADFNAASQYAMFHHPDTALKQAVSELISRLGNSPLTNSPTSAYNKVPVERAAAK